MSSISFEAPKKLNALSIIFNKGEAEALRLYPELTTFIFSCRGKSLEQAKKELLRKQSSLTVH